jgi:hypothetical protein
MGRSTSGRRARIAGRTSEDGIIDDPTPLPATLSRGTFVLGIAPDGEEYLQTQAPQTFEPGAFGQGTQELRGEILVPSTHSGEFMTLSTAKESGKHEADDFAQELLLSLQAAFDLSD